MRPFKYSVVSVPLCLLTVALFVVMITNVPASQAQTADGQTPAEEHVCDGKSGALWGLCVSYCEAMDCDSGSPHAADEACDQVFANYLRKSEWEVPPCEQMLDDGDGTGTDGGGGS
jgi:hypothetical protein